MNRLLLHTSKLYDPRPVSTELCPCGSIKTMAVSPAFVPHTSDRPGTFHPSTHPNNLTNFVSPLQLKRVSLATVFNIGNVLVQYSSETAFKLGPSPSSNNRQSRTVLLLLKISLFHSRFLYPCCAEYYSWHYCSNIILLPIALSSHYLFVVVPILVCLKNTLKIWAFFRALSLCKSNLHFVAHPCWLHG